MAKFLEGLRNKIDFFRQSLQDVESLEFEEDLSLKLFVTLRGEAELIVSRDGVVVEKYGLVEVPDLRKFYEAGHCYRITKVLQTTDIESARQRVGKLMNWQGDRL